MEISGWKEHIEAERQEKDTFFKTPFQSLLSFNECQKFKGLNYYPPDWNYRFELELYEHKVKERLKIEDTKGNKQGFLRWGEFSFRMGDTDC